MYKIYKLLFFVCFQSVLSFGQGMEFQWAKFSDNYNIPGRNILIPDQQGNVINIGTFKDTLNYQLGTDTIQLISEGDMDIFINKLDPNGDVIWSKSFGGSSDVIPTSSTLDKDGNIYIACNTSLSIIDVDPDTSVYNLFNPAGEILNFTIKLNNVGEFIWAKSNTAEVMSSTHLDTDSVGNLYTYGMFQGTVDLNPGTDTLEVNSSGIFGDFFIQKFDEFGDLVWAKSFGCTTYNSYGGLELDNFGNIYLTGAFTSSIYFDIDSIYSVSTVFNLSNMFVLKLDLDGNIDWVKSYGDGSSVRYGSCSSDKSGNIYINGSFSNTVDLNPGPGIFSVTSAGGRDAYVLKLDSLGEFQWAKTFGNSTTVISEKMIVDDFDNILVTGYFRGTVDFDPDTSTFNLTTLGSSTVDAYLTSLNTNGDFNIAYKLGGIDNDYIRNIESDSLGSVYLSGFMHSLSVDFNPNMDVYNLSINDYGGIFGLKLSNCNETVIDTITSCNSYTWIDGNTYYTSNNTATHTIVGGTSEGCDSIVVLDLTINSPVNIDSIVSCEPIVWIDGNTYSVSNDSAQYTIIGGGSAGCDSVIALHLVINEVIHTIDTVLSCSAYTWINGVTYFTSIDSVDFVIQNGAQNGCDSVITLDLTIGSATTGIDVHTVCDSLTWIDGNTYTTSNNTATYTLTNTMGCDSVVTLDLTIGTATTGIDVQTSCDSLTWIDGNTYTTSNNTATHILTNVIGCDSIVTLDLTIYNSTFSIDSQTSCDSLTWIDGNTYTTSNNTATYALINAIGCDSIITLDLTINNSTTGIDVQTSCDSLTWIDGNTYSASNNTATHVLTNAVGCDSLVTLNLDIITIDTSITISGQTIVSNQLGAVYQWIDCDNGFQPIAGETNQGFNPSTNGNYAVLVYVGSCVESSSCVNVSSIGINEDVLNQEIFVYPNPNNGIINIEFGEYKNAQVKVFNSIGQLIYNKENINDSPHQVKLNTPIGVYFVETYIDNEHQRFKLIVK